MGVFIEQAHLALQQAYSGFKFDPNSPVQAFVTNKGVGNTDVIPGTFKVPYSMQFNIGVQREIRPNMVLSADYVRLRGIGLPYVVNNYERRFAARTLDATAARTQVASILKIPVANLNAAAVETFLAANKTATIATFGLGTGSDTYFAGSHQGLQLGADCDRRLRALSGFTGEAGRTAEIFLR